MDRDLNILRNPTANQKLRKDGYAIIPLLNKEEIDDLSSFFYQHHPEVPEGLYATAHSNDTAFRQKMSDYIKQKFTRAQEEHLQNIQALGGTFMCKSPGDAKLSPHQDWNIVDENYFFSCNVWVPLVDVSAENGSIQVIPKSHLLPQTYRGINIPNAVSNHKDEVWEYMSTLEMKAGEALIYDHRLLHASGKNKSNVKRLVVVFGIIPVQAEMKYYYKQDNYIEEYACSPDFYMKGNPAGGPEGLTKIRDIKYDFPEYSIKDIIKVQEMNSSSFWKRMKHFISPA